MIHVYLLMLHVFMLTLSNLYCPGDPDLVLVVLTLSWWS